MGKEKYAQRDPARIQRISRALEATWRAYPDWRLGQIIVNASGTGDPFYVEDDVMEGCLYALGSKGVSVIDGEGEGIA